MGTVIGKIGDLREEKARDEKRRGDKRDVREDTIFWGKKLGGGTRIEEEREEMKGEKEVREVDRRKDKVRREKKKAKKMRDCSWL